MSDPRVILKYPNRRLYDTVDRRYITLEDVRRLVLDRIEFVILDKPGRNDITRSILLQVIADREQSGEPVMSRDFLSSVIRGSDSPQRGLISSYLEQSMKLFMSRPRKVRERESALQGEALTEAMAALARRNHERWRTVQDEIFNTLMRAASHLPGDEDDLATGGAPRV